MSKRGRHVWRPWLDVGQVLALALVSILLPQAAGAVPPEVSGVGFDDAEQLVWNDQVSAARYHVYRGNLQDLSAGYGACLLGNLRANRAGVPEDPPVDRAFFFLVTGADDSGEGTAGLDPAGAERAVATACIPARRLFTLSPNGDPGDGVVDGTEPRRNPGAMVWSPGGGGTQHDDRPTEELSLNFGKASKSSSGEIPLTDRRPRAGVNLHTGEFFLHTIDLSIPGRGLPLQISRSYHSQRSYDGPFGFGWDSSLNARLAPLGIDILYHDGSGRREQFAREDTTHFSSPAGLYAVLRENPDGSFSLRFPDGTIHDFHAFDGSSLEGAIEAVEDRNGDRMSFLYDHQGLLTGIVDTLGRAVMLGYDSSGRIETVSDFFGRQIVYGYDTEGNLDTMRSPVVTGTPNSNDFPSGKTTRYTYSSGFSDPRLDHNLLAVIRPNELASGNPTIQNVYDTDSAGFLADRVVSQTIGGTNPSGVAAGGTSTFGYESLNPGGDPADLTLARRRTTVFDRNGNRIENVANLPGNTLSLTRFTNREIRPGEPDYTTQYVYNPDGEVVEVVHPLGDRTLFTYDTPGADRFREGNLLEERRVADSVASGGRGDGRGGEITDLVWSYAYEPVFNRVITAVEPRGNDSTYVPQNGGPQSAARYAITGQYDYEEGNLATNGIAALAARFEIDLAGARSGLGDLNGDGRTDQAGGNLVRLDDPTVRLDPASNQAAIQGDTSQEVVTLFQWNDFGQLVARRDPEENRHEYAYHPETDPDGDGIPTPTPADGRILDPATGGYLRTELVDTTTAPGRDNGTDPAPAGVRGDFLYDAVGNLVAHIDGRGVLTRIVVNALDQPVEIRRAAATADASGPDGDPATGRGEPGLTAFSFKVRLEYDANDNPVLRQVEDRDQDRSVGPFVDTAYTYDILDRLVEVDREATATQALSTLYRYDPDENLTTIVEPEGNEHTRLYDERDLLFQSTRGATGSRGGTASTRTLDYDANGNPTRLTDGRGNPIDYAYDGFDRPVRTTDQAGNTTDLYHDPAGNVVRVLCRGPVGGPTPSDRSGSTNVDLEDTVLRYDELGRPFRKDRRLFVPAGGEPNRPALLEEGPLVAADGFVNRIYEYDRLSRPTFVVRDTGATYRQDYDGAGRMLRASLPDGSVVEWTLDPNGNVVERAETDLPSTPGPPSELFLTTRFHDALDRRVLEVDNLGQSRRWDYDSLDAVLLSTDPNGPPGGSIHRRSPGRSGITVAVNDHGNVTSFTRDGAGRLLTTGRILTLSGKGNGTTTPPPDTSNPFNPDGTVTTSYAWDGNSLLASATDDNGNTTTYTYDNLNRLIRRTADDGTSMDHVHDTEHNLTGVTDPNGSVLAHEYDPANRRTRTEVVQAATGIEGTSEQTFEYDGLGRLTRTTDDNDPANPGDNAEVRLLYDSLGRQIEEQQVLSAVAGAKLVDQGWRAEDLMIRTTYPSGREIAYGYGPEDRLVSVSDLDPLRAESASFEWFAYSRVHTLNRGNGVRTTMLDDSGTADIGFDGVRRIVRLRHLGAAGALLAGFEHTYDRAGNRLSERRMHHSDPTGPDLVGERWGFDSADRLVSFQEGSLDASHQLVGSPTDAQSWMLDGPGNWPRMTRNGVTYAFTPNNLDEYDEAQSGGTRVDDGVADDVLDDVATSVADGLNHAHDKNGNLTDEGNYGIVYDAFDRPVRAILDDGSVPVASYVYDALGRLVWREVINSGELDETRRYLYAPAAPRPRMKGDFSRGHEPDRRRR